MPLCGFLLCLPVMYIELGRSEVGVGLYPPDSFLVCSMWRVGVYPSVWTVSRVVGWWIPNDVGLWCGGLYVLLLDSG